MIFITNIRGLNKNNNGEQWAIVRSMKSKSDWIKQVTPLSPSTDLFHRYLELKNQGQWGQSTFQSIYVPQFLYDIKHNQQSIDLLNALWSADKQQKDLWLACFCTQEDLCHRSIIAGLLQGAGCHVTTQNSTDYSKYWDMFRQL